MNRFVNENIIWRGEKYGVRGSGFDAGGWGVEARGRRRKAKRSGKRIYTK